MQFKFPDVGEGIHEGTLVNWLVKEGDEVELDQAICEVETDKAIVEIPSPVKGKLIKTHHVEGDVINVGEILAEFETKENTESKESKESSNNQEVKNDNVVGNLVDADNAPKDSSFDFENYTPSMKLSNETIFEKANTKNEVENNKVSNNDNTNYIELNNIKLTTAKRMKESLHSTAQVTQFADVIVDKIIKERNEHKEEAKKRGVKLTYLAFIVKAYIKTLEDMPEFNAKLDLENKRLVLRDHISIAIAVNTENGLLVPVIKDAQNLSIEGIAEQIQILAEEARSGKLDLSQIQGQTATVTNYGSIGSKYSTPVLNSPDLINLGIGSFEEKVYLNKGHVESHTIAPISLTFDHQAIDGAQAVGFLNKLQEHLENLEY
ncbi:2-oxo acid dehydrogenase subunit E2 [bacterium]|jgi:pyruvate dehydrogenase E2 component (dihydrolipoamide acetyltransferase)|nr:2-oxo acid dehydrogenase subunit E2 [bacterium]